MATINIRDLFPTKTDKYGKPKIDKDGKEIKNPDCIMEVIDGNEEMFKSKLTKELADVYFEDQRTENAYQRKLFRYDANYSLDCGDGIENDSDRIFDPVFEEYVKKLNKEQLYIAINRLPKKQSRRVYAYYFLGKSLTEIADAEKVNNSQITRSIEKALANLKKNSNNFI